MYFSELPVVGGEKTYTADEVAEMVADAYHPEFGSEWHSGGQIHDALEYARKNAWNEGYFTGWDDCTHLRQEDPTLNPYSGD